MQFHLKEEIPGLLRDMTAAAEQAATVNPKPGDLKVTLNIGNATLHLHAFSHIQPKLHCSVLTLAILPQFGQSRIAALLRVVLCALYCVNTVTCCRLTVLLCWEDNASA